MKYLIIALALGLIGCGKQETPVPVDSPRAAAQVPSEPEIVVDTTRACVRHDGNIAYSYSVTRFADSTDIRVECSVMQTNHGSGRSTLIHEGDAEYAEARCEISLPPEVDTWAFTTQGNWNMDGALNGGPGLGYLESECVTTEN